MKPLQGIKVLDLSRVLAGPYCTALLADLGAEVIKLEPPAGDDYRHIGPFKDGESALFTLNNRGKQSLVLDLKDPGDLALAKAVAARVDVVVENFRPGVAARLGLGAEALRAENPRLVYCSISGFGQQGPFRDLPAYDLVVQAMSGLMAGTGEEGGAPLKTGESVADLIAGLFGSWAIMAALVNRNATGQGATLDVAMYDALFSMLTTSHALHFYAGALPQRVGNRHPLSTPFGCFATRDGQVVIAVLNGKQFAALATLIGAPDAADDPRFASDESRTAHEPELKRLIEGWSRGLTTEEAVAALAGAGLPAAPIWDIAQAASNEHALTRGLVSRLPHPVLGLAPTIGQPVRFDGEKPVAETSAPRLGGDRAAILREFGLEETA
ncbi:MULTISPECIES: CaiB/BaiF CoA transferase family protein [Paracoccus]|jgi:CoA:oxalate CoA-transferase|uniref:L-carnitine dehydratase/bile acid-inducible protein F n=1 Tax=Paracoccus denitrificans (strain Pd 1222) TaxID=318586 RepID=A1AZY1_PARDP|nr:MULTISPECIES: CoA transferase [Paracoccus]ABL68825.1 L-carnitine dehydratase/bile acid-inducible protein F [Paracoccus denitrificans PD1222]MBB4625449.1 CoA:oxalate CoA-transferase [Paracoccus denitrificans]MCU7428275.1 CoA transferase [Paracoccus denitrificans]MDK8872266.1 CoA transferase [Paracoccus sp. SSJ]QAR26872.1 CoA transferase [Paracoccus denitrificans]